MSEDESTGILTFGVKIDLSLLFYIKDTVLGDHVIMPLFSRQRY